MDTQGLLVAKLFYWASLLVGVPSALGTGVFGLVSLVMWWEGPGANTAVDAKVSDSLVNVVVVMAGWVGKVLSGILGAMEGLIRILAFVSLGGVVFAGLIYFTGRGLAAGAIWAKLVGSGLMLLLLFVSGLGTLTPVLGPFRVLPLLLLGLSGYSLWMIWRGVA